MRDEILLHPKPYKITIEFSGIIYPDAMSKEYLRIEKLYHKEKLTLSDLDEIIAIHRDYAMSNLSFNLEKGMDVTIIG